MSCSRLIGGTCAFLGRLPGALESFLGIRKFVSCAGRVPQPWCTKTSLNSCGRVLPNEAVPRPFPLLSISPKCPRPSTSFGNMPTALAIFSARLRPAVRVRASIDRIEVHEAQLRPVGVGDHERLGNLDN